MGTLWYRQHAVFSLCLLAMTIKEAEQRDLVTGLENRPGTGPGANAEEGSSAGKQPEAAWILPHAAIDQYPKMLRSMRRTAASTRRPQQQSIRALARKRGGKAVSCPPNSTYSACAPACPASCLDPTAPASCRLPCVKRCVCLSGLLLSNGTCVPGDQCQCWHDGKHYPVGSGFWTGDSCDSRCTCPSHGSKLVCSKASCPQESYCGVRDGALGCYRQVHGICRVHGDPHYNTFDKAVHHFMGNCTYTLAKVCARLAKLPQFNIEAKNEYLENPSRSFVHKVFVDVYGNRIEIHKGKKHQVLVDQLWRTLPVKSANGSVTVSRSGRHISLETDFQLVVNYDADHLVEIRMPTAFFNSTCGMCGNFNNLREDDRMMPSGQQASNATELGNSWRVPDANYDQPFCGAPDLEPPCTKAEEYLYEEKDSCGLLTNSKGPFQACHSAINPESFFDACVRDMCAFRGKQQLLCNTLAAYGDACQRGGVALANWRTDTYCLFLCPSNSEHQMCTSACPDTCADPLAVKNCGKPCVEGCQCNEGLLLSAGQCVVAQDCGCLDEGQYYEKGKTFWKADCVSRCRCVGNGTLICNAETCPKDQVCKVQDGILGCYISDMVTCHIFGGPHYITFDGKLYHVQGGCNYTAVEKLNHFSVTIRNERHGHQALTVLSSVAISLKSLHVLLKSNREVYVNGMKVDLPAKLDDGIVVEEKLPYVSVSSTFGLRVEFGGQNLFLEVDERHKRHVHGLCANQQKDFTQPEGVVEADPNRFARNWCVEEEDCKCEPVATIPPACSPNLKSYHKVVCNVISTKEGPFESCHWKVQPFKYVASCTYDQCASAGNSTSCRKSLEAYAAACTRAGVDLGTWWTENLCDSPSQCGFSCSFDKDLCLWSQSASDNFDWTRYKGSTPSQMTGPVQDHTTGEGYYLYVEGDNVIEGNVAHLVSPICKPLEPLCFSFWYHLFGAASLMSLRVYVVPGGEEATRLWIATGRKANQWLQANVTVPNAGQVQIIVEAVRGEDFLSDVAVDDISVTNGNCTRKSPGT